MGKLKLLLVALTATLLFVAPKARADVNDFVINDFHGRYELFNDVHGGRMTVTETIQLDFSDNNHGILRSIPVDYRDKSLHLDIKEIKRDGSEEPYTTYNSANNRVLKIGDSSRTVTGEHTYEIRYEMRNVIGFFDGHAEWYWDINGDQWQQPFKKVHGQVTLPEGWTNENLPTPSCYTGKFGQTTSACQLKRTERGYSFTSKDTLNANETLTVAIPAAKGLFTPRDRVDWFRDNILELTGVAAGIGLAGFAFGQWHKWGRDYKGKGTIIPEYTPPKNLTPAEVGLLADYNVDSRDLTATIIDLAVRGYIKIIDEETKKLGIFKNREFTLELTKDSLAGLKSHEKKLLETLFKSVKVGSKQKVKDIDRTKMYNAATEIRKSLKDVLTKEHGLFEESPTRSYVMLGVIMAISLLLAFVFRSWGWVAGMSLSGLTALVCVFVMHRRSHAGVTEYEKIQGLKLYMDTAEKDRMKMLQSVDREYAEPTRDVHLFEKLLPFAVALGVEKSWATQFDNIYREPPTWYNGNMATFNTVYFTNSLTSSISSFNSSFSTSTSSSSSGSGGGGFSGGGGGGGGGGGW